MENKCIVRKLDSSDILVYKKLLSNGLMKDEENFRITPADILHEEFPTQNTNDSFTLGAFVENELAGIVSFERDGKTREKLRHKGILFRMLIANGHRGKGISNLLIQQLLDEVKPLRTIRQINLTLIEGNTIAKTLYSKFGFKTFAVEHDALHWKGKYFNEEHMVLKLS
jgi:GNAT superfamily N-acetyltransferase